MEQMSEDDLTILLYAMKELLLECAKSKHRNRIIRTKAAQGAVAMLSKYSKQLAQMRMNAGWKASEAAMEGADIAELVEKAGLAPTSVAIQ